MLVPCCTNHFAFWPSVWVLCKRFNQFLPCVWCVSAALQYFNLNISGRQFYSLRRGIITYIHVESAALHLIYKSWGGWWDINPSKEISISTIYHLVFCISYVPRCVKNSQCSENFLYFVLYLSQFLLQLLYFFVSNTSEELLCDRCLQALTDLGQQLQVFVSCGRMRLNAKHKCFLVYKHLWEEFVQPVVVIGLRRAN